MDFRGGMVDRLGLRKVSQSKTVGRVEAIDAERETRPMAKKRAEVELISWRD